MYGCQNWTIRPSTEELMLLNCGVGEDSRILWAAKRSNQLILKKINPEYSLEGLMLKLEHFGHLLWRDDSLEKTLMLGKIEGSRRRGLQKTGWLDGFADSMDMGLGGLQELVMDSEAWRAAVHGVAKSRTWLSDWTELNWKWYMMWSLYSYASLPSMRLHWEVRSFSHFKNCLEWNYCLRSQYYSNIKFISLLNTHTFLKRHGNIFIWSNVCCYFVFAFRLRKTHYIIRDSWKSWYVAHSNLLGFWISSPSAAKFWICWRPPLQTCQTPA